MNPFYDQFKKECLMGRGADLGDIGPFYKSVLYQRGYGLLSMEPCPHYMHGAGLGDTLGNLFHIAWPVLKQGMQYLGKSAVSTAANIAQDAIAGRNVRDAAAERISTTARDIMAKAPRFLASGLNTSSTSPEPVSHPITGKRRTTALANPLAPKRRKKFGNGLISTYPLLEQL